MCCNRSARKRHTTRPSSRAGFSLVELMVVVVIIGLLAGAVTVSVRSYMAAAKRNTAKMEIVNIANAIDMYYDLEKSGYPTQEQGLEVLMKPSKNMIEGYLKTKKLTDPWGYPYQYFIPGPENAPFEVVSFGADRKEGGSGEAQDISSLDLKEDSP